MIYYNDLIKTIITFDKVRKSNKLKDFLLVGGRHDWHNPKILKDLSKEEFIKNIHINEEKHNDICQRDSSFNECSVHATCGIDYVIHSKTTLINKFDEKLVIGGPRFDMILLGVGLTNGYFCCDCTKTNFVIHQNHGYPKDFRGWGQLTKGSKDKRLILLNILQVNNYKCKGEQRWIHECPVFTDYKDDTIQFFIKN